MFFDFSGSIADDGRQLRSLQPLRLLIVRMLCVEMADDDGAFMSPIVIRGDVRNLRSHSFSHGQFLASECMLSCGINSECLNTIISLDSLALRTDFVLSFEV
ncbi:hypothetical protein MPTK1_2g17340 [Marchantia polymorpha subsp. ruderalis]|uniref:Uncharacterized protein n=1 Tax=Marchantia polymorpha TaxID=3197 RepID=A0A2R6WG37_MARPO|nr:hypothetical protein MARPO_0094s0002 [Marchantia polymorpha]BBN02697.1 hypothetical protein Mp_2g17340 [Marchantia polymorpha subsp. ruderalis]|eukprot:PTQ32820.1 hypothetical protein MARPO_0094s0002 [Marchantia polymorpha]